MNVQTPPACVSKPKVVKEVNDRKTQTFSVVKKKKG